MASGQSCVSWLARPRAVGRMTGPFASHKLSHPAVNTPVSKGEQVMKQRSSDWTTKQKEDRMRIMKTQAELPTFNDSSIILCFIIAEPAFKPS
ncbi:uncharacterized [Tachysurus ichikawai]